MKSLASLVLPLALAGLVACTGTGVDSKDDTDVVTDTEDGPDTDDGPETDTPDTDGMGPDTDITPLVPDCITYCSEFQGTCGDSPMAYPDEPTCGTICANSGIGMGAAGDTSGNTLGCRIYHAQAAATDADLHCPHASLWGGGVCGDLIENYCTGIEAACTGDNAPTWTADCATDAAAYPAGTPGATSGDSLDCRLYHLGAAMGDPGAHCGHAGPTGNGVCVDP